MEGSIAPLGNSSASYYSLKANFEYEAIVVQSTLASKPDKDDAISLSSLGIGNGLPLTAKEIIQKINEQIYKVLPEGVESLKPEEVTPEATADGIVKQVTALFDGYAKRHQDFGSEELLQGFMDSVRAGVKQGYEEAAGMLEALGAFNYDGVQDGVEETMRLIEEKLAAFENTKRKELGLSVLDSETVNESKSSTSNSLLGQAGKGLSVVA